MHKNNLLALLFLYQNKISSTNEDASEESIV